jgi:predicted RNA polymerase sigma factor
VRFRFFLSLSSLLLSALTPRPSLRRGEPHLALLDITSGLRLKPTEVKDVANVQCLLGELRAQCGDNDGAQRAFDLALALTEHTEQRKAILSSREQTGL